MTYLRMIVVIAAAVTTLALAQPAMAMPRTGKPPQSTLCGGKPSAGKPTVCNSSSKGVQGIGGSIASSVAGFAAQKLAGFALSQAGLGDLVDPTSAKLAELELELGKISGQLETLQTSLNQMTQLMNKLELQGYTIPLGDKVSQIQSLYDNYFVLVLDALTDYASEAQKLSAGTPCDKDPASAPASACATALRRFNDRRSEFLNAQANPPTAALNSELHSALVPSTAGDVMGAYAAYLMAGPGSTGFLTSADSDHLFAFYHYYAEYEALATFMKGMWQSTRMTASEFDAFIAREITGYQASEHNHLPQESIPKNTAIMLPVNPSARTSTKDRPMLLWDSQVGTDLAWDPRKPAGSAILAPTCSRIAGADRCAVDAAINTYNTTAAGLGFSNWHVPSKAEWDAILNGQFINHPTDAGGLLLQVFGDDADLKAALGRNPFIWNSAAPATVDCDAIDSLAGQFVVGRISDYAHTALPTSASLKGYPSQYPVTNVPRVDTRAIVTPNRLTTRDSRLQYCRDNLAAQVTTGFTGSPTVRGAGAQLFPTRTTTAEYMLTP